MKVVGVIGGSGLYEMEGLKDVNSQKVSTPFGDPSDEYVTGMLGDVKMIFLPRHGRGHRFTPTEVNYRANIYGMKKLGAEWVISVSAVGSMKEEIKPGHIVIVDQFFDRTKGRPSSFYGNGVVGHVEFADPVCPDLSKVLYKAANEAGATVHMGGTYICIEGPQFSTRAESKIYRGWGVDVIGMTNIPEAKLAREAEVCYATVALSTDYDCWHETEESVTVEAIIATLKANVAMAKDIIMKAVPAITGARGCKCGSALKYATITDPKAIPDKAREDLALLIGKYLPQKTV
ncbi:MAG TPA: S-methyl-5'-thioadenosine phosphorylase [Deltaproteobacteria bacterium]|nr:MAG: methylthioadenosine phosphorylase [Deltaproteobacteria bacterium GWA2_55_82]OGQ64988.1 MAG: methylthioadenosine phosphorylase [Deltaproteobacteria bacterium RIFCSPLOWO2_02_FULL_55_12]OIJ73828.1 MAG: methylthioadenosine phosphorylase [Deltaproteobacteria bacterium GWC2_55_46]HBG45766.1 S-methyl-5'-thioadenosine phosphorylase [Deltaproteobacteria bacterium]HCY09815.1 S-methyl-5'-thioadenosine phosphorylase [Deltaproteobacteria bacterium]